MIDSKIDTAIRAAFQSYSAYTPINVGVLTDEMVKVFSTDKDFMDKVDDMDDVFDAHPHADDLREVFFDLLMVNFFSADLNRLEADYLDSPEWESIEEETLDRGTELLNLLLYLNECADEDIEPSLEDYLQEFLLIDESEFQDEYQIYEPIIANQILVESSPSEVRRVADTLPEDEELGSLFYPMLTFFQNMYPSLSDKQEIATTSAAPDFDMSVIAILETFNPR
ncbi:hypothetical protein HH214_03875 [Mucilaginibacter robiniae]|uniref:Uncharacterized protein n=1 Tax=Mucilaginibacter robiniae TaxID=2728022 RepID=A0A7L5DVD7_9SPHI|nr:hypothetical protein [Mucilaginibacter robiniae]QJD95075.1 hypothetical protein HH214_03875 [Mucilaginibacter robiniae]